MRHVSSHQLLFAIAAGTLGLSVATLAGPEEDRKFRLARIEMVERDLAREGITDERVLLAMRTVPRHEFIPQTLRHKAYFDQALAIGHKQTISPPFIVAYMTQVLEPRETDVVLEIGTGSGYQAAVLSGLVKEVYTIEIVEPLGKQAAERLKKLGYKNVHTKVGDGYLGWPEHAPFDKIIVTCSPEDIPQPLVEQLREGGKMIIPLGERYQQTFYLLEKKEGKLEKTQLLPALFVPMTGKSEEERKVQPDPLNPTLRNGSFEIDSSGAGHPDGWHYQRQLKVEQADNVPDGKVFVTFTNTDPGRSALVVQGLALDGRKIKALQTRLWVRGAGLEPGHERWEHPALALNFYDAERRQIGQAHLGPWEGSFAWRQVSGDLAVPAATREVILQVGLNGATGTLSVDGIRFTPRTR